MFYLFLFEKHEKSQFTIEYYLTFQKFQLSLV